MVSQGQSTRSGSPSVSSMKSPSNLENSRGGGGGRGVCGSEQRTEKMTGFRTSYWERQNITEDLGVRKIIREETQLDPCRLVRWSQPGRKQVSISQITVKHDPLLRDAATKPSSRNPD